jgi:hypothetical protein
MPLHYSKLNMFQQVSPLVAICLLFSMVLLAETKIRTGRGASSSNPYRAYAKQFARERRRGAHATSWGKGRMEIVLIIRYKPLVEVVACRRTSRTSSSLYLLERIRVAIVIV